jgi:GT2 family glycosyltransferase
MKIDVRIPFEPGCALGNEYNRIMREATSEWVLLLDHDVLLLNPNWYTVCVKAIEQNPQAGLITAYCNNIGNKTQIARGAPLVTESVRKHREFARSVFDKNGFNTRVINDDIGGFFLLVKKEAWDKIGGFIDSFFHVDTDFARSIRTAGYDVVIMEGMYCLHLRERDDKSWIKDEIVSSEVRQNVRDMKRVIYSVHTGTARAPLLSAVKGWDIKILNDKNSVFPEGLTAKQRASWAKINGPFLFPEYEASLYVDSDMEIVKDPVNLLLYGKIVMTKHPERKNWREELNACWKFGKTTRDRADAEAQRYSELGLKDGWLYENGFLLRHHTDKVKDFCRKWSEMYMLSETQRDQPCLAATCALMNERITGIERSERDIYIRHDRKYDPQNNATPVQDAQIYYMTPFSRRGLGVAYNKHCAAVPDGAWICIMDSDIMLFPSDWGNIIEDAIKKEPTVDVWTCCATRATTNDKIICPGGRMDQERNLVVLHDKAVKWAKDNRGETTILPYTVSMAGHLMVFRKSLWRKHRFAEVVDGKRVMGIDTEWTSRLYEDGRKFGLINGLLAVHYYSLGENRADHIKELESLCSGAKKDTGSTEYPSRLKGFHGANLIRSK